MKIENRVDYLYPNPNAYIRKAMEVLKESALDGLSEEEITKNVQEVIAEFKQSFVDFKERIGRQQELYENNMKNYQYK